MSFQDGVPLAAVPNSANENTKVYTPIACPDWWLQNGLFRSQAPAANTVATVVRQRKALDKDKLFRSTVVLAAYWPRLLLEVRMVEVETYRTSQKEQQHLRDVDNDDVSQVDRRVKIRRMSYLNDDMRGVSESSKKDLMAITGHKVLPGDTGSSIDVELVREDTDTRIKGIGGMASVTSTQSK
jgi:hypothetical protein